MTNDLMKLPSKQRAKIRESLISYSDVSLKLRYCSESGDLIWLKSLSNVKAGSKAGALHKAGYRVVSLSGQRYLAHRIIWLLNNKEWPDGEIDHIDGDPKNNRIENLRVVSESQNQRNRCRRSDNTSGHQGVSWDKTRNCWQVNITINGVQKNYGRFKHIDTAILTAKTVYLSNGFSERHSEGA